MKNLMPLAFPLRSCILDKRMSASAETLDAIEKSHYRRRYGTCHAEPSACAWRGVLTLKGTYMPLQQKRSQMGLVMQLKHYCLSHFSNKRLLADISTCPLTPYLLNMTSDQLPPGWTEMKTLPAGCPSNTPVASSEPLARDLAWASKVYGCSVVLGIVVVSFCNTFRSSSHKLAGGDRRGERASCCDD